MQYKAKNLKQIADMFEVCAGTSTANADKATTKKLEGLYRREAYVWRAAADIIRNTEIAS